MTNNKVYIAMNFLEVEAGEGLEYLEKLMLKFDTSQTYLNCSRTWQHTL